MKRALIVTTTSGFLSQFELNNVRLLQERGYQIHYATNFGVPIYEVQDEKLRNMGGVLHHISIEKNPFKIKKNIWALRELIRIIDREGEAAIQMMQTENTSRLSDFCMELHLRLK